MRLFKNEECTRNSFNCLYYGNLQAVALFKSYFGGAFDEDAIRNNFVLIYELLDGTLFYFFWYFTVLLKEPEPIPVFGAFFNYLYHYGPNDTSLFAFLKLGC
jgi:hypothetical protein